MHRRTDAGMTLIELMVGVAILAILAMVAMPAFGTWVRDTRLRSAAEALRSDLQMARAEAIRRNVGTRLQFVSSLDGACALSSSGKQWVVNLGLAQSPAGACGDALSDTDGSRLVRKSPVDSKSVADVRFTASRNTVGFDALGRQSATTNPAAAIGTLTVQLTSASGTCVAAGGAVRCLNVVVSPGGDTRVCDPARSGTTDPMSCRS